MRSYNTFSMEQRITNLEEKVKEGGEQSYPVIEANTFYKVAEQDDKVVFEGFFTKTITNIEDYAANDITIRGDGSTTPGYPDVRLDAVYKVDGTWTTSSNGYNFESKPINVPSEFELWLEVTPNRSILSNTISLTPNFHVFDYDVPIHYPIELNVFVTFTATPV